MTFSVNEKKKRKLRKAVIHSHPVFRWLDRLSVILGLFFVAAAALYGLVNMTVPELSMVRVQGVPEKDTLGISMMVMFLVMIAVLLFVILKTLVHRLAGINNNGRTNEELVLDGDVLRYSFRGQAYSTPYERNVTEIHLGRVQQLIFNETTGRLLFKGRFEASFKQFDKKGRRVEVLEPMEILEEELYDYFEPDLVEILESRGINITRTGEKR
ncbi:MAG TPA: hypothetical protein IAB23_11750 [Candidatus Scybalocola faecavium]|nr:hypothetical protein [Candidatus Scybalocola faecavium]